MAHPTYLTRPESPQTLQSGYLRNLLHLLSGSAAVSKNCPNEAVRIKCDAQEGVTDIRGIDWEVFVDSEWLMLSTCRTRKSGGLECIHSTKPHGIEALSVENDTLVIKRTSLKASQNVSFRCTVRQRSRPSSSAPRSFKTIDLSVECK